MHAAVRQLGRQQSTHGGLGMGSWQARFRWPSMRCTTRRTPTSSLSCQASLHMACMPHVHIPGHLVLCCAVSHGASYGTSLRFPHHLHTLARTQVHPSIHPLTKPPHQRQLTTG